MFFLSVLMAFVTAWSQASGHIMGTSPCAIEASRLTVDYVPSIATDGMLRLSDRRRPLLGWWLLPAGGTNSTARNLSQSAYRIVVTSDPSGSDDLIYYDSGKVVSNDSVAVPYGGPPVPSRAQVWWRVEVWDQEGASCGLSLELASWEVPLVDLSAWQGAQWLTQDAQPHPKPSSCSFYQNNPAPLFRRAFSLSQEPSNIIRARVYVTGLGYYKLFLNGQRVGNAELDPGVTSYNKTIFYTTYDVTLALRTASNLTEVVLGVSLGNGWYNFIPLRFWGSKNFRDALAHGDPMFRLLLCVDYADTSTQHVISSADGQWRVGGSEILQNSIHLGTVVDRRLEPEGWSTPSFRVPSSWKTPFVVNSDAAGMKASLRSQYVPTVQRVKTILPVEHHRVNSSSAEPTYIVDIGRQIAGICQFCVKGLSGATLHLRYGELLYANGTLNGQTSVAGQVKYGDGGPCAPSIAYQQDSYILRGDPTGECYTPSFTWHGFRYIEFTGNTSVLSLDDPASIECYLMRSAVPRASSFDTSDPLLLRINQLHLNTQECNMMSIQSDCPHRERLGYGGDALMTGESFIQNFDMATFYEKRVRDYLDAQGFHGGFPETAPYVGIADNGLGNGTGPIGWETFLPVAVTWMVKYYANIPLVEDAFNNTLKYVQFLDKVPLYFVLNGLGDWMGTEKRALGLTGLGFQFQSYSAFVNMSDVLGNASLALVYRRAADRTAHILNSMFLDEKTGIYRDTKSKHKFNATQCGQAMPLFLQIAPTNLTDAILDILRQNVTGSGHILTGGFASKYLLMVLSDHGLTDLAYSILTARGFPSFSYMMDIGQNGLTNATTVWESWFTSNDTFSHNHPMFTSSQVYLYQGLAGIQPDPATVGLYRFLIKPKPPRNLTWVTASLTTARGVVATSWTLETASGLFRLNVTLPPNTVATVFLPGQSEAVHSIGSGHWEFQDVLRPVLDGAEGATKNFEDHNKEVWSREMGDI